MLRAVGVERGRLCGAGGLREVRGARPVAARRVQLQRTRSPAPPARALQPAQPRLRLTQVRAQSTTDKFNRFNSNTNK